MRRTYQIICHIIAALVVVQAAVIAWGVFTLGQYLDRGTSVTEDTEVLGFDVHAVIGQYVIPVLAVVLLVIALIMRDGITWAGWLILAVVVQVALAYASFGIAWVGIVHGIVAFAVAGLAETAARSLSRSGPAVVAEETEPA
ncbi:MAG: hypothetical protein JWM23_785 [Microbacteriaceae bacterium]|jgi:hypothetical protein|nr:hypothetical protein [Microbacteriaceae bacterium]